jgi:uncharacterized protein (DUF2252 family)
MTERRTTAELTAVGEAARKDAPASAIAAWRPATDRPDPVALLIEQAATRIEDLVPVRYGRMLISPFAYYRGAALPMAADLASVPVSGITTQLCGDAHISNFGLFASPERDLVFDINDFDETLPGPWEWDVLRLATSVVVAARSRGFSGHEGRRALHATLRSYATRMHEYASMRAIEVYYAKVDAADILASVGARARSYLSSTIKSAAHHDALHEIPKLTEAKDGDRRIVDHPPIISHPSGLTLALALSALGRYRETLQEDRRVLLDRYTLVDTALKVVGVGSVGLYALAALFEGAATDDPLFLQVKEAESSVLERFLAPAVQRHHGERVVTGQRRLQAASDILLGWTTGDLGRQVYLRQLQDQKAGAVIDAMTADDLKTWGELCAWALARGHARSGEPVSIAAYLGSDGAFEQAAAAFASAYADQTERDFEALKAAAGSGRITVESGV